MKKLLIGCGLLGGLALALTPEADAEDKPNPVLVIGLDGGEWSVIEEMWAQGKLPNFKKLADGGVRAKLTSHYGKSPVIWTSMATGMKDSKHGITGFTIFTDDGDIPFSSTLRETKAIWNMLSSAGRGAAVLNWWASWPAEDINGHIISEKSQTDLPNRVSPASWQAAFDAELVQVNKEQPVFEGYEDFAPEDRVTLHFGEKFLKDGEHDLVLAYFRGTDSVSHKYWKWYRPQDFGGAVKPEAVAKYKDMVPDKYAQTDEAIGRLLAAAGPNTNVFVVSDHGFHAADPVKVKITIDSNELLEAMGLLTFEPGTKKVDCAKSVAYTYRTEVQSKKKRLRLCKSGRDGGNIAPGDEAAALARLSTELAKVTFDNGATLLTTRAPNTRNTKEAEADLILEVEAEADDLSKVLVYQGKAIDDAVSHTSVVTGSHPESPPGLFIAYGPDINPKASAKGIDIHDITPTLLYALGLPIADDFDGRPWLNLFTSTFQAKYPMQQIDSWGRMDGTSVTKSTEDEATLQQLRELGYIE